MPHRILPLLIATALFAPFGGCHRTWSGGSTRNSQPSGPPGTLTIDADFPGGNVIADCSEDDTVLLRPDQRDSSDWWSEVVKSNETVPSLN